MSSVATKPYVNEMVYYFLKNNKCDLNHISYNVNLLLDCFGEDHDDNANCIQEIDKFISCLSMGRMQGHTNTVLEFIKDNLDLDFLLVCHSPAYYSLKSDNLIYMSYNYTSTKRIRGRNIDYVIFDSYQYYKNNKSIADVLITLHNANLNPRVCGIGY